MTEKRKLKTINVTEDMIQHDKTADLILEPIVMPSRSPWYKNSKFLIAVSFTLFLVLQGYLTLRDAFASSIFLGAFYLVIIGFAVAAVGLVVMREFAACMAFRRRKNCRETNEKSEAYSFLARQKYNRDAEVSSKFAQWKQRADSYTSAKDVKSAYSELILEPIIDCKVARIISANSSQAAAFTATSPFIFTDMLFVLASNLRMTRQISKCYGIDLGLSVRYQIYKNVFHNMMISGGAELLTDMASPLGVGLLGKFSAKIGQGMLAGLYAARLGIKVAELCRPVAFTDKNKLSTTVVFKAVYNMFKERKLIEETN